jgi:hypothetical protein
VSYRFDARQGKTLQWFFDLLDNGNAGQKAFDAFVRKLDRRDPSYPQLIVGVHCDAGPQAVHRSRRHPDSLS